MSRPIDPRLLRHAPAGRRLLVTLTVLQLAGAGLTVAQAALLTRVIVSIFTHTGRVSVPLAGLAVVALCRAALAGLQEWVTARVSLRVRSELRRATVAAAVRLGPEWIKRQPPGLLATATGPGLDGLDGYVTRALPALVAGCVVPPIVLAAITWSDWQSGLLLLVLLPLVPLFMALVGLTTGRLVARQYATLARLAGQFLDLVRGLTTLRIYGRAETSETTVRRATDAYRRQTIATLRVAFLSGLVLDLLAALSVAVVAVDVGLRLDHGHITFRAALLVLFLAPELFAPLRAMGANHHATEEGRAAAAAALDVIDEAPAPRAGARAIGASTERVQLDAVSISYPGRDRAALHDVTLHLRPFAITALTGPSGAGKSTLLATLLGFVVPASGHVLANGRPRGDLEAWRTSVAWLPQRPRPSQATVADEVRLGDPAASDAAVAASCLQCHTPAPSTLLGQDGTAVSAGQRRRIALARALLRAEAVRAAGRVPLVLLDEPSEDLDVATASVVAQVVDGLRGWATVVLATHSASLAAIADVRVEVADGRIVRTQWQRPVRPAAMVVDRVPVSPRQIAEQADADTYRLRDLIRDARAGRRLSLAVALAMLASLSGLGLLATSMWLISRAAQHPNVQALAVAVVGVRTFAIARPVLRYFERLTTHDSALRMLAALRVRVFGALRPLPPNVLGSYRRGDLLRRFVGDVDGAQEGLVRAVVPAGGAVAGVACAVVVATALVPMAGVALGAAVVVGGVLVPLLAYRLAGDGAPLVQLAGRRDHQATALLDAMDELVAYGRAGDAVQDIADSDAQLARVARRPAFASALGAFGTGAAGALGLVGVLAAAQSAVQAGSLPVVDIGVLAVGVLAAFEALSALPQAWVAWARCRAGLRRVAEITGQRPAFAEPGTPVEISPAPLGLSARALTLAPALAAPPVLRDVAFDLAAGTRLAITGPSGCGKSTLLAAALRLLPARSGRVALGAAGDAADLRDVRAGDVPPAIAGSLQGDHVFDATLRDNLRVVRPDASDAVLDNVARRVGLFDTVHALPDRWSTPAGPDGAALSGGQRQRLLLARALLADPRILVLDEPTAHLDAETEATVLDDLLDATAGRTVLLTTHRHLADHRVDGLIKIGQ